MSRLHDFNWMGDYQHSRIQVKKRNGNSMRHIELPKQEYAAPFSQPVFNRTYSSHQTFVQFIDIDEVVAVERCQFPECVPYVFEKFTIDFLSRAQPVR